ncbi:transporter substrate-binding domain-containing protein [Phyllobacterium sp. SB3]|uniref:transporter substrate-binding domain-containing protein n=1 Tax=Phyllobacterium sp. SB3 TaxID=3156073 RepID=UPI0032AF30C5
MHNGHIDALISDKFVVVDWLNNAGRECCKMLGAAPETEVGIGICKGDDALHKKFNKAIDAIIANGTHKKIVAQYLPFDIYQVLEKPSGKQPNCFSSERRGFSRRRHRKRGDESVLRTSP